MDGILRSLTRFWVLSLLVLMSTQCVLLLLCLLFIYDFVGDSATAQGFTNAFVIALPLNIVTVCVCVALTFEAFEGRYRSACGMCDDAAIWCYVKLATKRQNTTASGLKQSLLDAE